jgi:hypothetical protein
MNAKSSDQTLGPAIRRARLDQLLIYEISESELENLERGSPDSLRLNFAIFLLGTAISFTTTLATTQIDSIKVWTAFFCLTAMGFALGTFLLCTWFFSRRNVSSIFKTIRSRLPPDGDQGIIKVHDIVALEKSITVERVEGG